MRNVPKFDQLFEKNKRINNLNVFEFNVDAIRSHLSNFSKEEKSDIINKADAAIKGKLLCFSSLTLDYGYPINWHFNPMTGKQNSSKLKWYEIPDFDPIVGDVKVIWEASRFTHFLLFARAYLLTNDRKYYDAYVEQMRSWLDSNPYSFGTNYKCGQEATLRMVNTLIAFTIFRESDLVDEFAEELTREICVGSYNKVLSNFFYAHKCIKNNHTFTEILGIVIGAYCSDDKQMIEKAFKLMDLEILNQFDADGGFRQYSFNYQRFTFQIFEVLLMLEKVVDKEIVNKGIIKKSVEMLYNVTNSKGEVPNYGSNDGALIFPLNSCPYTDYRPVLNTLHYQLNGKKLYHDKLVDEELLWFSGELDIEVDPIAKKRNNLSSSGFHSLNHSTGLLMMPIQDFRTRPAHMDQCHVDIWEKDINIFCDQGTFSYASKEGQKLSRTAHHNTIKVPSKEQMGKRGAFMVTDWTQRLDSRSDQDSIYGSYRSKMGYSHHRKVTKEDDTYIIDDVVNFTDDTSVCTSIFHSPCEVEIVSGGFNLINEGKVIAEILTNSTIEVEDSIRSRYYLTKEPIKRIILKESTSGSKAEFRVVIKLNIGGKNND